MDWVFALIAGLAAGYFRGRLTRIESYEDRCYDLAERARTWRGAYELQRDHVPEFPRFDSGASFQRDDRVADPFSPTKDSPET